MEKQKDLLRRLKKVKKVLIKKDVVDNLAMNLVH